MAKAEIRQLASAAIDKLVKAVEAGHSDQLKSYLAMMGRFHRYSPRNSMLIYLQRKNATHVAGYGRWRQLGRKVKRGEKAIRILAPIVLRKQEDDAEDKDKLVAFKGACVFDIGQTEGRDLPQFAKVSGDPGEYAERLKRTIADRGITLEYSDALGAAEGLCSGDRIVIKKGLQDAEAFSVMVHEMAHALLHRDQEKMVQSRTVREVEAEATAFVVCQAVGLDCSTAASDYIQLYDGKKETLLASLERIHGAAGEIIEAITDQKSAEAVNVTGEVRMAEAA